MTNNVKQIDPCALASLTTGIMLCEDGFSVVHGAAEWLLGHPVWTHEFVEPATKQALISAVLAQYPDIPVEKPTDWRTLVSDLRMRYGRTVPVLQGNQRRDKQPMDTLAEVMSSGQP